MERCTSSVLATCVFMSAFATEVLARTWTDATGKYSAEAELIECRDGQVHLRKADGTLAIVPFDKLSLADQEYVRKRFAQGGTNLVAPGSREHLIDVCATEWLLWAACRGCEGSSLDINEQTFIEATIPLLDGDAEQRLTCFLAMVTPGDANIIEPATGLALIRLQEVAQNLGSPNPNETFLARFNFKTTMMSVGSQEDYSRAAGEFYKSRWRLRRQMRSVLAMDMEVARAAVRLELAANNALTREIAKALVRKAPLVAAPEADDVEKQKNALQIALCSAMTPERAAFVVSTAALLRQAFTSELAQSRSNFRETLAKAVDDNRPCLERFQQAVDAAARRVPAEVVKAKAQARSLIEEAEKKTVNH